MNVSHANRAERQGCRTDRGDQKTLVERAQVETAIESVAEGSEISRRVLSKVEGMVATGQTGLEIADHGVDQLELGDIHRSEERRVGKECVSTCRSRWSPYHKKKKIF